MLLTEQGKVEKAWMACYLCVRNKRKYENVPVSVCDYK